MHGQQNIKKGEICVVFCYIQALFDIVTADGRSRWPRGLRREFAAARLLGLRFRIHRTMGVILLSVVCCQADVFATGRSVVQRSPTECVCVTECDQAQQPLNTYSE